MSASRASPPAAKSTAGFTLIELLVVIAILAVVASLLLPAAAMVRQGANAVACTSNMRQFGIAFTAYVGDNEGRWPSGSWNHLIQSYVNEGGMIGAINKEGAYRLARCMSAPRRTGAGVSLDLTYGYTGVYYNSIAADGTPVERQYPFAWADFIANAVPAVKATVIMDSRIHHPAQKIVLSETWDDTGLGVGQAAWGVNCLNDRSARNMHRGGSNVLCADIHVQVLALPAGLRKYQRSPTGAFKNDPMWRPYHPNQSAYLK